MRLVRRCWFCAAIACSAMLGGCAETPRSSPWAPELLALAPDVTTGRLENGLRYVVIADRKTTAVKLGIAAGQFQEADGESGVATRLPQVMVRSMPAATNARAPWTVAYGDLTEIELPPDQRDARRAIATIRIVLDTRLTARAFAETAPDPEPLDGDDLTRLSGTRLVRHPWRGTADDARHLDLAALQRFRDRWYVPSRMTVVVRGPWNRDETIAEIKRQLGTLPPRRSPPDPPLVHGSRGIVVAPGCCYLRVSFLQDVPAPRTRRDLRAALVRTVFERALMHRLNDAVTPWGTDAPPYVMLDARWLTRRVVSLELVFVTDAPKDRAAALLVRELERIHLYGFTADELRRARTPYRPPPGIVVEYIDDDRHCSRPDDRVLYGILPISCETEAAVDEELLPVIRDDEINALRASVDPRTAAFGAISSARGSATKASIEAAILRALARPVRPWTELPPLMATRPRPGGIVGEQQLADGVELLLQNGARVRVHSSSSDRVAIRASSPGGALAVADPDVPAMRNVAVMVSVAGLGAHDGLTTHRLLEHAGIELYTSIQLRHESIDGFAPAASVEQLFQAVHLAMTANRVYDDSPLFTDTPPDAANEPSLAALPARMAADLGLGVDTTPSPAHAVELYRARFGNAGDFTFDISGPVALASMKELIETYVGSLPDDGRRETAAPLQVLESRTELVVKTRSPDEWCSLQMNWMAPVTPATGFDEPRVWWAITAALLSGNDHVYGTATARDGLGYAMGISASYPCDEPTPVDEMTIRDALARLGSQLVTNDEVMQVRRYYEYGTELHRDLAREARAITAPEIRRLASKLRPPSAVLLIHTVR